MKFNTIALVAGALFTNAVSAAYTAVPSKACNAPVSTFTAGVPHGALDLYQVSSQNGEIWSGQLNIQVQNTEGYSIQQVGVNQANPNINLCNSISECGAINWADYTAQVNFTPIDTGSGYTTPRLTVFFYFSDGPISSASYIMSCQDGTSPEFEWSANGASFDTAVSSTTSSGKSSHTKSQTATSSSESSSAAASSTSADPSLTLLNKAASSTAASSTASSTATSHSSGAVAVTKDALTGLVYAGASMLAIVVAVGVF